MQYEQPELMGMPAPVEQGPKIVEEPLPYEQVLWKVAEALRGSMDVTDYKNVILGLVFLRYVADTFDQSLEDDRNHLSLDTTTLPDFDKPTHLQGERSAKKIFRIPPEARWGYLRERAMSPGLGALIDKAMNLVEHSNPRLRGVLPKIYGRLVPDQRKFSELIDLIDGIRPGTTELDRREAYSRVYEYFLAQFASAEGKKGGEFYTPRSIAQLLVQIIRPVSGRLYDPCCGSGGMFVEAAHYLRSQGNHDGQVEMFGQEANATTWQLARMNLALEGVDADLGSRGGDSFLESLHPHLKADFVLANPPFNMGHWGEDQLQSDPRWCYGVPLAGNANFAWLQHVASCLTPQGRAAVIMANASVSTRQFREAEIRRRMIEDDLVAAIIALPGQLFHATKVPVTVSVLERDKSPRDPEHLRDRRGKILFIDASMFDVRANSGHREMVEGDRERLAGVYPSWRGMPGADNYIDVPGFCASVPAEHIARHQFLLTPGRYVNVAGERNEALHARHGMRVKVSLPSARAELSETSRRPPSFVTVIPPNQGVASWRDARYGQIGCPPEVAVASEDAHWAPVDRHLEQYENGMRSALESTGWPLSRLISFVQKANYLRSQRSAERAESLAKYSHQERLVLPIEPRLDAVFGVVREVIVDNRCLVISLLPGIKGPFLAAWMNSEHGRKCRSAVMPEPGSSPRTMSPEKLLRFLDGLIVPVPELDVQASIAETVLVLRQVRQRAKQLSAGVWLAPSTVTEIKSAAQNWLVSTAPTAGR